MTSLESARIFKAFCDERRIDILRLLSDGEKCACRLLEELNISQPTLSHHMKILCDAGIVVARRDGKWTHYRISDEGCNVARTELDLLITHSNNSDQC